MKTIRSILLMFIAFTVVSCEKGFLDERPSKSLLVPTTLQDFQALLDNHSIMNLAPNLGVISSDDFFITNDGIQSATIVGRNTYLWAEDIFQGAYSADWSYPYQQVFYANVILEGLEKMPDASRHSEDWKNIKGSALFFRAFAMSNLVQQFAAPYTPATARQTAGLPVRLSSDVNERPGRGTLQDTYDHIIADLIEAEKLLPVQSAFPSRPTKPAALALLARLFLSMGDFQRSETYSAACMNLKPTLLDYNSLTLNITATAIPFPQGLLNSNPEVIFYSGLISTSVFTSRLTQVDSTLFRSYHINDLRRAAYFVDRGGGVYNMKGNYTASTLFFGGLALDEVYLTRAECLARTGRTAEAMNLLNDLLMKRWKKGTFTPLTAVDQDAAMRLILTERRKSLISRGLRWGDLRRLNLESKYATTLTRVFNGQTYTLLPGSARYTLPLPDAEIAGSGFSQNPR